MDAEHQSVALYWDLENIHASLVDQAKGAETYRQTRFTNQEPLVDAEALMEFSAPFGVDAR